MLIESIPKLNFSLRKQTTRTNGLAVEMGRRSILEFFMKSLKF